MKKRERSRDRGTNVRKKSLKINEKWYKNLKKKKKKT